MKETVYSVSENIAIITLNNPQTLNGITDQMVESVYEDLQCAEKDPEVRAIAIWGAGKAFCGGGDLKTMKRKMDENTLNFNHSIKITAQLSLYMKRHPKPIVIGVHRAAAGAGCNLALAGDFCIAAEGAKFVQSFTKVGLIPDAGGLFLLTRVLGANRALQCVMMGEAISAEEATNLGMVYKVCPPETLQEEVLSLARQLTKGPGVAYAETKRLLYESVYKEFESYIAEEVRAQVHCSQTADFREGVNAFLQKRTPVFEGK